MGKSGGLDGCRAGWLAVTDHGGQLTFRSFPTMASYASSEPLREHHALADAELSSPDGWRSDALRRLSLGVSSSHDRLAVD